MRKFVLLCVLPFFLVTACKETPSANLKRSSPQKLFPGLFEQVQNSDVFSDSKTFPDCTPLRDPVLIMEDYTDLKTNSSFKLHEFVKQNFAHPDSVKRNHKTNAEDEVVQHIKNLWSTLERKPNTAPQYISLIALPNSYIVPGGRFREIYYWDSYFTMLGLAESGRSDLIESMVNNFAWLIRKYGFIPNGNRTYYLTRSQPPFFSLMLKLLTDVRKDKGDSILNANRDVLEKEYWFWMDDKGIKKGAVNHVVHLADGTIMNRYCDIGDYPREEAYKEDVQTAKAAGKNKQKLYRDLRSAAESGWDFSSRWLADGKSLSKIQTTDIIPVDLNCLLYHHEKMLEQAYNRKKDRKKKSWIAERAERRQNALTRFCWDNRIGYFRDLNWRTLQQTPSLSLAGAFPLYFKMVNQVRANLVAQRLQKDFLKSGGLVTTPVNTGQQWDAPNGWAPLQWIAVAGLENYGNQALAREISQRWISLNIKVFRKTGKLMEKYNVVDTTLVAGGGEYPTQDGFGWTNGVLLKLMSDRK